MKLKTVEKKQAFWWAALRLCWWYLVVLILLLILCAVTDMLDGLGMLWYMIGVFLAGPLFIVASLALLILNQYRREAEAAERRQERT